MKDFDLSFVKTDWKVTGETIARSLSDLHKKRDRLDLDVYLPSFGVNLQRDFVWNKRQQSQFIESIVYRESRHLPRFSVLIDDEAQPDRIYRVVDGKQRLTTLLRWLDNKVEICVPGFKGTIATAPPTLVEWINGYSVQVDAAFDLNDTQLIEWFNRINFTGTPQDEAHKQKLESLVHSAKK